MLLARLVSDFSCHAQTFVCHPLTTQELLPVANVNVVIQDSEGYMWYGTAGGGVCRDDGYHVIAYNSHTAGKNVMGNDEITCMAEDRTGNLWFGTRAGVFYLNKEKGTMHRVADEHVGIRKVNCISVTPDGCVWVGIQRDILKFSKEGKFLKTLSIGDNTREEVKEMMVDTNGILWITILRGGLVTVNPKNDQLTRQPWDYPAAASYILEDTLRHCYWVGTWGGGIVRYPDMLPEAATMVTTERQKFGSEVYNLWIDHSNNLMWVATMDDVYAYKIEQQKEGTVHLTAHDTQGLPKGKKLINKLFADKRGNVWVPGYSPHTFILSKTPSGNTIHRDEVPSMTKQMGYKIMVNGIAPEDGFYWIYQNRTRLSLYDPATGGLSFMANEAFPTPLSTQKPLSKCKTQQGVWTCNGKKLIHAWHEGMNIHWEEVEEALMPNYISALSDEGNGRLLIGTEKQVFLYDYKQKKVKQLTDSVGIIQQVASPRARRFVFDNWHMTKSKEAVFTTDPKAAKVITDKRGHIWTLNELTLEERNPETGAYRVLNASDPNISMDYFTDIMLAGDSICLGGIGAFCLIGNCLELDKVHPDDRIIVTRYDTLQSISVSTMNHLHAASIQFAYRLDDERDWKEMPVGENTIDISGTGYGNHTLFVKATDEYGIWHEEQKVYTFSMPLPWYLRWYAWCIYVAISILLLRWVWQRKEAQSVHTQEDGISSPTAKDEEATHEELSTEPPFITEVKELVQKNLDNAEYSVDDMSRDLGMSRMNMYRKFQSVSETTPSEFIKEYRLSKAAELLRTSSKSITEIAYEVGFTSPQYLAKCFKDEYGMTPKQYRNGENTTR